MTTGRLILRSLRYYWRTHLGVVAGAALATSILVGALAVGDSVRASLRELALSRLGNVHLAMASQDRFFRSELAESVETELKAPTAPAITLIATGSDANETYAAGSIDLVGVDSRFGQVHPDLKPATDLQDDQTVISAALARRLHVQAGQDIIVYFDDPTRVLRDMPVTRTTDTTLSARLTVKEVLPEGVNFSLLANQVAPKTAFVPLKWLGEKVQLPHRANLMLVGPSKSDRPAPTPQDADQAIADYWQLTDAGLTLTGSSFAGIELRSKRVFIDPAVSQALRTADDLQPVGIFAYFVNELRAGDQAVPYSMVAGMGTLDPDVARSRLIAPETDDGIVINTWLAEKLGASRGEQLTLTYYLMSAGRKLQTDSRSFRIERIVTMEGLAADPSLMPDFPGLAGVEDCRDWELGDAIDIDRLTQDDREYWTNHRGTPKAFVSLQAAREMWGNRYGNLTAARFREPSSTDLTDLSSRIRSHIDPASLGLFFLPVRQRALEASKASTDFGGLFLSLSFFLIAAALALTAMLFSFGIQKRRSQIGTLLAIGWGPRRVLVTLLTEGAILAAAGSAIGLVAGPIYTRLMLTGLSGVWSGAVAGGSIRYAAGPETLATGAVLGALAATLALVLALRKHVKQSPKQLISGSAGSGGERLTVRRRRRGIVWAVGVLCLGGAGGAVYFGLQSDQAAAGAFFAVGALLLTSLLCFAALGLMRLARAGGPEIRSTRALAVRNMGRRRGRSLATIGVLAAGAFLLISVESFRMNPLENAGARDSGTGGFQLWAESALPIVHDLDDPNGRDEYFLSDRKLSDIGVVPFRLREGDDASCLNLNRAQKPRLLGVDSSDLAGRDAFSFAAVVENAPEDTNPWLLLNQPQPDGAIPAIADYETVLWALHKQVGDTLEYTDQRGQTIQLRIVAATKASVLQGPVIISERSFSELFPTVEGYRLFLIDTPPDRVNTAADELASGLSDYGMEVMTTVERLSQFTEVVNTYLTIFSALGGLGLLLGSVGVGIVVMRNVLERRSELAILRAVGFRQGPLRRMVLVEHWILVAAALVVGGVTAMVAIIPAMRSSGGSLPIGRILGLLAVVALNGCLWAYVASFLAFRGRLLSSLRSE